MYFFPYSRLSYVLRMFLYQSSPFPVPMSECLGKHSCMRSPFPQAILNGTYFFRQTKVEESPVILCVGTSQFHFHFTLSILTVLFLPSPYSYFSFFIPTVSMCMYWGQHVCLGSTLSITIVIFFPSSDHLNSCWFVTDFKLIKTGNRKVTEYFFKSIITLITVQYRTAAGSGTVWLLIGNLSLLLVVIAAATSFNLLFGIIFLFLFLPVMSLTPGGFAWPHYTDANITIF